MKPLYEISNDYFRLLDNAETDETIRDALDDTLEGIEYEFDEKAVNIAKYIKNLQAEMNAVKEAEDSMKRRRAVLTKKIDWLKEYTKKHMERLDKNKISCPEFVMRIRKNPPSVIIDNENLIPDEFKKESMLVNIDKKAIYLRLKNNEQVNGSRLIQNTRLDID